jgi:hypothetical protein
LQVYNYNTLHKGDNQDDYDDDDNNNNHNNHGNQAFKTHKKFTVQIVPPHTHNGT